MSFSPTAGGLVDPLMFRADPPILVGEQYVVHALINNPSVLQLQHAGDSYPPWVKNTYLQLPNNLSQRITELATTITATAETPYDKAIAITDYLRSTITYSITVAAPPDGSDPLIWFLFDSHKGFCNYYATAEVILLRSVGVPTRMVVGFAQGEYQPPDKYIVLEKDAHAWPEVYFPGIGWVEFEPTSSQPVLERVPGNPTPTPGPSTATQNAGQGILRATPTPNQQAEGNTGNRGSSSTLLTLVLFGLLVITMVGGVVAYATGVLDKVIGRALPVMKRPIPLLLLDLYKNLALPPPVWLKNWAFVAGLKPIERSFGVVYQSLRWLGVGPSTAWTPAEAAAALINYLPAVADDASSLLKEYELFLFSPRPSDIVSARRAVQVIRREVFISLFRQRLDAFWNGLLRKSPKKPE
jgi:transglutaminase-like putative cysteine protease